MVVLRIIYETSGVSDMTLLFHVLECSLYNCIHVVFSCPLLLALSPL